ncbi:MAG TPA: nuclear transport factor 2 family protein [Burkholderiaceae bacterium]|nr:nuclear transport factor 2 family protein [Burkholderiaceae bacterium]
MNPNTDQIVDFFENLSPNKLQQLSQIYAPQARFKDPFNEVVGIAAIQHIFEHMYVQVERPRFTIKERVVNQQQCFLTWEFRFNFKTFKTSHRQCILGATHLVFDDDGLITVHRDYWDAAEELYEKIPFLGGLMRWLKRQAS